MAKVSFLRLTLHHGNAISKPITMCVFLAGGRGKGAKLSYKAKKHNVLNRLGNLNSF